MYVGNQKQLQAYDQALIDYGYSIEELVDLASDCLLEEVDDYNSYFIVCGPGNNGADAISLAIKLHRLKKKVLLGIIGGFNKLSEANTSYLTMAKDIQLPSVFISEENVNQIQDKLKDYQVIVDGIFGFGLNGDIRGVSSLVIPILNESDCIKIAIDIPSGLNCNSGNVNKIAFMADKTICLTALKQGYLNPEAYDYTGEIIVKRLKAKDLGKNLLATLVNERMVVNSLEHRQFSGYKNKYGHVVHITGCDNYRGAALLASKASVYSGSGLVSVYSSKSVLNNLIPFNPECIVIDRDVYNPNFDINNYDACLIGSGLGLSKDSYHLVINSLMNNRIPLVIDGDAITITSENLEFLQQHQNPIVLTPHIGEFKRLTNVDDDQDIVIQAKKFAVKYKVIMVVKGPNTIITDGIHTYRNISGNGAMATAGMGDALAGVIVSLIGQGYNEFDASVMATYIHGVAGDNLAEEKYTVLSHEVIAEIPKVMKNLVNKKFPT